MTTVKNIIDYFSTFAPLGTEMDFDNCGLLAGDESDRVSRVLVTLDITPEVVREAGRLGCELIISHHPVIFHPINRLQKGSAPYLLASLGIAALCMHTNLDLSEDFGVNTCLANAVGIKNPVKAAVGDCLFYGMLEEEIPIEEFAQRVKQSLDCEGLRYTAAKANIKRAAVSSGAGGSDIFAAAQIGADVLVTGEIKHHEINAANELGVSIVDAGHFKSEDIVILPLINRLSKQFADITFTKSSAYGDKMKYLS